jgi:hypothetical protein
MALSNLFWDSARHRTTASGRLGTFKAELVAPEEIPAMKAVDKNDEYG